MLGEGIAGRIAYKFYADGNMVSNKEADLLTQPGQTGGKTLRRVASTLGLGKDTYRSQEKRADRQITDMRHGGRRGQGNISGELSPRTYFDFMEAAHRDTAAGPLNLTKASGDPALASIAASNTNGTITFGAGNPVAAGLGVGDLIRISSAAEATLNGQNFLITGFSGTQNRTMAVFPAPTANAAADTGTWSIVRPGKVSLPPSTGFVKRKVGIELANDDMGAGRFFPEHRVTGYRLGLPVNGMNTFEASFLGRGMKILDGTSAPAFPYFTNPADPTTTGVTGPMDGVLLLGGQQVGTVTGINIAVSLAGDAPIVRSQKFVPEVFLGELTATGDMSALLDGFDLLKAFTDETELELLTTVFSDTTPGAEGISIYIPRIKLGSGDTPFEGNSAQTFSGQFQALKHQGNKPGVANTTIRIHDTAAA